MLVLSRKVKDRIVLPELGISIEVREIRGNQIRLGIDAPKEIKILRGELESPNPPSGRAQLLDVHVPPIMEEIVASQA